MKTILFSKTGTPVSDYAVQEFVDEMFKDNSDKEYNINNALIIDEIRARVKEKRIELGSFTISIQHISPNYPPEEGVVRKFNIDKDGRSNDWNGFGHPLVIAEGIMMRLL